MKADHKSVIKKIKIARGQLDGIINMIEEDRYCIDVANQILAAEALLKSANREILRAHIRHCVSDALQSDAPHPELEEVFQVLEKMTD